MPLEFYNISNTTGILKLSLEQEQHQQYCYCSRCRVGKIRTMKKHQQELHNSSEGTEEIALTLLFRCLQRLL
jgi:hypothetical protein